MSIHDEIGDLSGGQLHLWNSDRRDAIIAAFKVSKGRSKLKLDRDVSGLDLNIAAAEIARNIYENQHLEFFSSTMPVARLIANSAAGVTEAPKDVKKCIGFFGNLSDTVPAAQALGWLSYAFDAGATPADLIAWGIDEFTVIQLQWWQRRPGETRLNQHIRALRNGWALPWLAEGVRAAYGNLIRFVDKGAFAPEAIAKLSDDIAEVREVLAFFDAKVQTLTGKEAAAWAKAFGENVHVIAPDAHGRWASLVPVALRKGDLRHPTEPIARYLQQLGYTPKDVGSKITQQFFGRVDDLNVEQLG